MVESYLMASAFVATNSFMSVRLERQAKSRALHRFPPRSLDGCRITTTTARRACTRWRTASSRSTLPTASTARPPTYWGRAGHRAREERGRRIRGCRAPSAAHPDAAPFGVFLALHGGTPHSRFVFAPFRPALRAGFEAERCSLHARPIHGARCTLHD